MREREREILNSFLFLRSRKINLNNFYFYSVILLLLYYIYSIDRITNVIKFYLKVN